MKHRIVVYEVSQAADGIETTVEVYKQMVENLSIPALVDLVNNGRRRTRTGGGKAKGSE